MRFQVRFSLPVLLCVVFANELAAQGVSIQPSQVNLSVSTDVLSGRGTGTATGSITVSPTGPNVAFNASIRYLSSATGWLSISPASSTTPATLTVVANGNGLAPGTYSAQIVASSAQSGLGTAISVLFTVGSSAISSGLSVVANPSGLTFFGAAMPTSTGVQTLSVVGRRGMGDAVAFRAYASSDAGWLSVPPVPLTTPARVDVTATQIGLAAGTYNGTVTLVPSNGGSATAIPVVLVSTGPSAAATFSVSQTAVTITHQIGTAAPAVQRVNITSNTGLGAFTATTTTPWLRLVSQSNLLPATSVTDFIPGYTGLQVDPTGLAAGTYLGSVTFSAPGTPTVQVPVSLEVTANPGFNVQPSSLVLDDGMNSALMVVVTGTGGAGITFSAGAASSGWLSVTPTSGSTASGQQVLTISAAAGDLAAGTYNGTVTLTASGSSASFVIPVRLNVSSPAAAVGNLTSSAAVLKFSTLAGQADSSQPLYVNTDTSVNQAFTAVANSPTGWLTVQPFLTSTPAQIRVSAVSANVSGTGPQAGSILLTSLATGQQISVPVSFDVSVQAISASPASITLTQTARGMDPPPQQIQITSNAPATFSVADIPPWLRVSPPSGTAPGTISVWTNVSLAPPGTNPAVLRIIGPNNQLSIPVSLVLLPPSGPTLGSDSLAFTYQIGSPPPSAQIVEIGSSGDAVAVSLSVNTSTGVPWLKVSPPSGTAPMKATVSIDPSQLVPGSQTGTITVTPVDQLTPAKVLNVTATIAPAGASVVSVLNAATLQPGPIAPGEIVTLTGFSIGPVAGVSARPTAAGAIETTLGDTRVTFDGTPAPILFTRSDQVNAIVPYSVYGRVTTRVQVQQGSNYSLPVELRVVDAVPGLFTSTGLVRGPAAALNADYTINSAANPAARGSVITLFGTGEGQTDPGGQDGRIILTDLRRPVQRVTARIGGRDADVSYAGSAPLQVSGVFQINVAIPRDIDPGQTTVEIQVGGVPTQSGVTISVR